MNKEELDDYLLRNEDAYIKMISRKQADDCEKIIGELYRRDIERKIEAGEKVSQDVELMVALGIGLNIKYSRPWLEIKKNSTIQIDTITAPQVDSNTITAEPCGSY